MSDKVKNAREAVMQVQLSLSEIPQNLTRLQEAFDRGRIDSVYEEIFKSLLVAIAEMPEMLEFLATLDTLLAKIK